MMKTILFVCTGNTCRSPMCAAVLNAENDSTFHAFSRGLYADGSPISKNAVLSLKAYGILSTGSNPYASHVSATVSEEDIQSADAVFGVTLSHTAELKRRFPAYADRIYTLPVSIADPFGQNVEGYKAALENICEALHCLFPQDEKGV